MVIITQKKILDKLLLLYLVLFPFGQLLRGLYLTDVIVLVIAIYVFFTEKEILEPKGKFISLLIIGIFSLLFSLSFFDLPAILLGAIYFVRLISYILFYFFIKKNYQDEKNKEKLLKSLLIINGFVVLFGFIQYFFFYDLRFLKSVGWDDHYFRLVSTFLDPTFTGIILLVGLILLLSKKHYLLALINLVAIALTYSRSTYLALVVSIIYFFILKRKKILLLFPILLLVWMPFLPRPASEGAKLERTYSVIQKFDDAKKAVTIFSSSPIFGIGFNNVCKVKEIYFGEKNPRSHSCSGLDNSVLFILATTGITGLIFFLQILTKVRWKSTFGVILVAVLVHSLFANSLFYPFVMGLLAITLVISKDSDI